MKLANPRTETSPNFKAFRLDKTATTTFPSDLSPVDYLSSSHKIASNKNATFFSPGEIFTDKQNTGKSRNEFSLTNTLTSVSQTNNADRLNKWINRFSFQSVLNRNEVGVGQYNNRYNIINKDKSVLSYKCLQHLDRKTK